MMENSQYLESGAVGDLKVANTVASVDILANCNR